MGGNYEFYKKSGRRNYNKRVNICLKLYRFHGKILNFMILLNKFINIPNFATTVAKFRCDKKRRIDIMKNELLPSDYKDTLELIIQKIELAQQKAVISLI